MKFIDRVIGTVFPSKLVGDDGFSKKESERLQSMYAAYFDDANRAFLGLDFAPEGNPHVEVLRRGCELPMWMPDNNAWLSANEPQLRVVHAGLMGIGVDDEQFARAVTHLENAARNA